MFYYWFNNPACFFIGSYLLENNHPVDRGKNNMNKVKPASKLPTSNYEETPSTKPTKSTRTIKIVLMIETVVAVVLTIIVVAFLSQKEDAPLSLATTPQPVSQPTITPHSVSQHTIEPGPIAGELGLVDKFVNTSFYPLAQLMKAHPVPSIIMLVGLFLTIVGVAITLGVVLNRPVEPVDVKDVIPDENELDHVGEESFWQQNKRLLIGAALGLVALVSVLIIGKITKCTLSRRTSTSEIFSDPPTQSKAVDELLKCWLNILAEDIKDRKAYVLDEVIPNNVQILNKIAALKKPKPWWKLHLYKTTTLLVGDAGGTYFDYHIKSDGDADLYVGLYSSKEHKDKVTFTNDYYIFRDESNRVIAMPVKNYLDRDRVRNFAAYPLELDTVSRVLAVLRDQILEYDDKK
jgi:hypothetical protein